MSLHQSPLGTIPAADVGRTSEPGDEARRLLEPGLPAAAYFERLVKHDLDRDAVRFLAHLLPKREAVWWGLLCVWQVLRPEPDPATAAAVAAILTWLREPTEDNRRLVRQRGDAAADPDVRGLARAAFWSEGSMAPSGLPEVKPPPELANDTAAGAVLAAANRGDPARRAERYRQFLLWGEQVASGSNRWEESPRNKGR